MVGIKVPIQELIRLVYFLLHLLNPIYKRTSKKTLIIFVRLCRNYTKKHTAFFCWFLFQNKHFLPKQRNFLFPQQKTTKHIAYCLCASTKQQSYIIYYIKILSIFVCNLLKLPFLLRTFWLMYFFFETLVALNYIWKAAFSSFHITFIFNI